MSMELLANHIIAVAQENNLTITNLQLQKILYFCIKISKIETLYTTEELEDIYDSNFYVWQYGPVIPDIYMEFKKFSSEPIIGKFNKSQNFERLNDKIIDLLKVSAFKLVSLSHQVPFWKEHQEQIIGFRSDIAYGLNDI